MAELTSSPIPVPTFGASNVFTVKSSIHISAPPEFVFNIVTDPASYPLWNTFTPHYQVNYQPEDASSAVLGGPDHFRPGTRFTQTVYMNGRGLAPDAKVSESRPNAIRVTLVDRLEDVSDDGRKGFRISWIATNYYRWMLRCERVQEFVDDGSGGTDYICWESFGGPVAYIVKYLVGGQLVERFADCGRELKAYAEGVFREGNA